MVCSFSLMNGHLCFSEKRSRNRTRNRYDYFLSRVPIDSFGLRCFVERHLQDLQCFTSQRLESLHVDPQVAFLKTDSAVRTYRAVGALVTIAALLKISSQPFHIILDSPSAPHRCLTLNQVPSPKEHSRWSSQYSSVRTSIRWFHSSPSPSAARYDRRISAHC